MSYPFTCSILERRGPKRDRRLEHCGNARPQYWRTHKPLERFSLFPHDMRKRAGYEPITGLDRNEASQWLRTSARN